MSSLPFCVPSALLCFSYLWGFVEEKLVLLFVFVCEIVSHYVGLDSLEPVGGPGLELTIAHLPLPPQC